MLFSSNVAKSLCRLFASKAEPQHLVPPPVINRLKIGHSALVKAQVGRNPYAGQTTLSRGWLSGHLRYDKAKFFDEELQATGEINVGDVVIDLKKLEALLKMDNVRLKENEVGFKPMAL